MRTDGLNPDTDVYIGRANRRLKQSKWHNPFRIGRDGNREEVIAKYKAYLHQSPELISSLPELKGKHLVCWCAPEACHGDVLIRLANP